MSFDGYKNTGAIDVKMDGSVLELLDWASYIISIAKTSSKKFGALIRSMKCISLEVALYLYKSTMRPCMEYC